MHCCTKKLNFCLAGKIKLVVKTKFDLMTAKVVRI